jgi:signal transduction histidine kinase/DNA-binding NarL/FixJ family response regulator
MMDISQHSSMPHILVADDNAEHRLLIKRILTTSGYEVIEAVDGYQAVNLAFSMRFDLIILDVQMPNMDGFKALETLRAHEKTQNIPIVIVTSKYSEREHILTGLNAGANDYLLKPIDGPELLARAKNHIAMLRLERKLEERNKELQAIIDLGAQASALSDPKQIGQLLAETLSGLTPKAALAVILLNEKREPYGMTEKNCDVPVAKMLMPKTLVHHVIEIKDGDVFPKPKSPSIKSAPSPRALTSVLGDSRYRSGMAVPLLYQDNVLGVVVIASHIEKPFSQTRFNILRLMAKQVVPALSSAIQAARAQYFEADATRKAHELEALREQLYHADKLASLGQLITEVSHEINAPLQALELSTEMISDDVKAGNPVDQEMLSQVSQNLKRLGNMAKSVLMLYRDTPQIFERVAIDNVIRDVLLLCQKRLESLKITSFVKLESRAHIRGMENPLRQVTLNLLNNAMDALPNGGIIRIESSVLSGQGQDKVVLIFEDNGVGIAQEELDKIFHPRFTTKMNGTGLGLSVTKNILEGHHAHIEVTSEVGKFTRFKLMFDVLK